MAKRASTATLEKKPSNKKPEVSEDESRASRSPAVTRALRILRLLADSSQPLGVNAIARELDIFPSTCLHILRAMEAQGFVMLDPEDKRWSIGLALITVARGALEQQFPTRLAQLELNRLTEEFNLTSIIVQLDSSSDRMVVLAAAHAERPFGIQVEIGRRFPAFMSATGRCLAVHSNLSRTELRQKFDEIRWENPPKFETWMKEIEEARRQGVGVDHENFVRGFTIYAAPIFENGKMKRSISLISVQGQLADGEVEKLKQRLREAAERLSL